MPLCMSSGESRWIQAHDALTAMTRVYASAMQADLAEARKSSQASILRYLSAGDWPARAGAYHCEFTPHGGAGRRLEKLPSNENDCWVIPREYWQIIVKSGADLNANWHLGEFDLPPFQDEAGSYSGFARNVEFDRNYLPEFCRTLDTENIDRTDDPGRPAKGYSFYKAEFQRRSQRGDTLPTLAEEAEALLYWFRQTYPFKSAPTGKTIENRIRADYRRAITPTK